MFFIPSLVCFGLAIGVLVALIVFVILQATCYTTNPGSLEGHVQFPAVYPLIDDPETLTDGKCADKIVLNDGSYRYANKLRTCSANDDCLTCRDTVLCQDAPQAVKDDQRKRFDNASNKYCLPKQESCIPSTKKDDFSDFRSCQNDADCSICTEPNSVCTNIQKDTRMTIKDITYTAKKNVRVCLPQPEYCNPNHGRAVWVETDKGQHWECVCDNLYTGPSCNTGLACSQDRATPSSQHKQKLLVNIGSQTGEVYDGTMGFPAGVKRCTDDVTVPCKTDNDCKTGTCELTTVCQCDGIDSVTGKTYKPDPKDPNNCVLDDCSVPVYGGRHTDDLGCVCSGQGYTLWKQTQTGIEYTGACADRKIGNVTIPAGANCAGKGKPNENPRETELVQAGDKCIFDPCTGRSGDPNNPQPPISGDIGYWDPDTKVCMCSADNGFYDVTISAWNKGRAPQYQIPPNGIDHICIRPCDSLKNSLCSPGLCQKDFSKPLGYSCKCPDGYKPNTDGTRCLACVGPDSRCVGNRDNNNCCKGYCDIYGYCASDS